MSVSHTGSKELKKELNKLSVIVPAHNEAENLRTCVLGIEKILEENKINREIMLLTTIARTIQIKSLRVYAYSSNA